MLHLMSVWLNELIAIDFHDFGDEYWVFAYEYMQHLNNGVPMELVFLILTECHNELTDKCLN
jgi:hypothetical protein